MFFRALVLMFLSMLLLPAGGASAQVVNRQTREKSDPNLIFYRYKGVDLPLKSYVELRGNRPLVKIVDGRNTLWVSELTNKVEVLDEILALELDAMTGAGDDQYFGTRWASALDRYQTIYDIITQYKTPSDLERFPAIRSYLLLRMGQCHHWLIGVKYADAQRKIDDATAELDNARAAAADRRRAHLQGFHRTLAKEAMAEAERYTAEGEAHRQSARKLLERALAAHSLASKGNSELYQAHNELGIMAFARGGDQLQAGNVAAAEKEYRAALTRFQQARSGSRGQEYLRDNIVATRSALADIAHFRADFASSISEIERAMAVVPAEDPEEPDAAPSLLVQFHSYHQWRDEDIVLLAPLEAGLVVKYLTVDRDRKLWPTAQKKAASYGNQAMFRMWREIGQRHLKAKRWEEAAAFYEGLFAEYMAVEKPGAPEEFQTHVTDALVVSFRELGESLYEAGRYREAVALYQRAMKYVPNSEVLTSGFVTSGIGTAGAALADGEFEDAIFRLENLKKIYEAGAGSVDVEEKASTLAQLNTRLAAGHLGLVERNLAAGKLGLADAHADFALDLDPARSDFLQAKARVLQEYARQAEAGGPTNWDSAKIYYDQAVRVAPFMPRLRLAAGSLDVRIQIRNGGRRVQGFVTAYGPFLLLGLLGLLVGVPLGRVAWTESARRRRVKALRHAGTRAYNEKRWTDAVASLNDYRRLVRGGLPAEVLEILARSYRRIGDYENALRHFDLAAARHRDKTRTYYLERCEIYIVRKNLPLAMQALRRSENLVEDVERMIAFVNYLRESEGKLPFFREAVAALQLASGDTESSRANYQRLHEGDPNNPRYLRQLAEIGRMENDLKGRFDALTWLVEIDSTDAHSLRQLGALCADAGQLTEAVDYLTRAQDIQPLVGTRQRIAELLDELRVREAESELQTLIEKPRHPAGDLRMADLYLLLGRPHVARKLLEGIIDNPEHGIHASRLLGLVAYQQAEYAEAVRCLRGYLTQRPNLEPDDTELDARWFLGLSHEGLHQPELAAVQFQAIWEVRRDFRTIGEKIRDPRMRTRTQPGIPIDADLNPESSVARELDMIDLADDDDDPDTQESL